MNSNYGDISTFGVLWRFAVKGLLWGLGAGFSLGALFGLPFYIIGAIFGAMYGAIIGTPIGLIAGVVMGLMELYLPPMRSKDYRFLMRAGGVTSVVLCSAFVFTGMFDEWWFTLVPTAIAGLGAVFVSHKVMDWWLREFA